MTKGDGDVPVLVEVTPASTIDDDQDISGSKSKSNAYANHQNEMSKFERSKDADDGRGGQRQPQQEHDAIQKQL